MLSLCSSPPGATCEVASPADVESRRARAKLLFTLTLSAMLSRPRPPAGWPAVRPASSSPSSPPSSPLASCSSSLRQLEPRRARTRARLVATEARTSAPLGSLRRRRNGSAASLPSSSPPSSTTAMCARSSGCIAAALRRWTLGAGTEKWRLSRERNPLLAAAIETCDSCAEWSKSLCMGASTASSTVRTEARVDARR